MRIRAPEDRRRASSRMEMRTESLVWPEVEASRHKVGGRVDLKSRAPECLPAKPRVTARALAGSVRALPCLLLLPPIETGWTSQI